MAVTDPSAPPPPIDPAAARAAAEDILSRPEFQPRSPSLLSRFFGWLGDRLGGGEPELSSSGDTRSFADPGVVRLLMWIVLAGLVVAVVVVMVRWVRGSPMPFRRKPAKVTETDEISALDQEDPAGGLLRSLAEFEPGEVEALEAAGQWRDALLARYRGAVAQLIGAGVVDGQPGASSAELRAKVDAQPSELATHFARLTATFETVWYGGAAADEALAAEARREALAVDAVVGSTVVHPLSVLGQHRSPSGIDAAMTTDIIVRDDTP